MEGYHLCPLIDAKKGEVFFALYRVSAGAVIPVNGVRAAVPGALRDALPAPCLCFGTGVGLCKAALAGIEGVRLIEGAFERLSGEALLRLGLARAACGAGVEVRPIYGRKSEAEIKFNLDLS
jgi:tRNA A37 threonylcarbamoyladenosine modification protein TsaB